MSDDKKTPIFKLTRRHRQALAMGTAATVLVVGLGAFGMLPQVRGLQPAADTAPVQLAQNNAARPANPRVLPSTGTPFSFADLVERVSPAVVTIRSEGVTRQAEAGGRGLEDLPPQFRDFFERFGQGQQPQQPRRSVSAGSGFIIDRAGFIVTNNHVIEGASKITVVLPDDREFIAKLIGTDAATDVALLKIESKTPLASVDFGNDRTLRVGDWVVAVGNPFGLSNTVTAGIVSSLGRDLGPRGGGNSQYNDFIQIDAPINTGNSGGPTFDLRGQVVGMNSMIFSPSGGSVGIGFAIPATTVQDVVAQLKQHGRVSRGYLGVQVQQVTPDLAAAMGLKEGSKGALVASVVADGPAAKAGFQQGDIITAINGQQVEDNTDLTRKVALVAAGQSATFAVNRQGKAVEVKATMGLRPSEQQLASNSTPAPQNQPAQPGGSAMGMGLAPLTPQARRARQLDDNVSGVVITRVDPDSNAAEQGLQPGDVVLKINNRDIANVGDVQNGIAEARRAGRKSVLLLVARAQGQTGFVAVEIGNA